MYFGLRPVSIVVSTFSSSDIRPGWYSAQLAKNGFHVHFPSSFTRGPGIATPAPSGASSGQRSTNSKLRLPMQNITKSTKMHDSWKTLSSRGRGEGECGRYCGTNS